MRDPWLESVQRGRRAGHAALLEQQRQQQQGAGAKRENSCIHEEAAATATNTTAASILSTCGCSYVADNNSAHAVTDTIGAHAGSLLGGLATAASQSSPSSCRDVHLPHENDNNNGTARTPFSSICSYGGVGVNYSSNTHGDSNNNGSGSGEGFRPLVVKAAHKHGQRKDGVQMAPDRLMQLTFTSGYGLSVDPKLQHTFFQGGRGRDGSAVCAF